LSFVSQLRRHGEHELADVLATEQFQKRIRELVDAALDDLLVRDQPAIAQPPAELGAGPWITVGVVGSDEPDHRGALADEFVAPLILAIWPATLPTAAAAPETTTVSSSLSRPTPSSPK
jgi:hypothetical protein